MLGFGDLTFIVWRRYRRKPEAIDGETTKIGPGFHRFQVSWFSGVLERLLQVDPIFLGNLFTPKTSNPVALKIGLSLAFQGVRKDLYSMNVFQHGIALH